MDVKKIAKAVLFPHIAVMLLLLPAATAFLVYTMVFSDSQSSAAIASYVLAAYTLTVWCLKVPQIIRFFKDFKSQNRYALLWCNDTHLRVNVSLLATTLWNTAYAVFQLCLGIRHRTFWFYSLAGYYFSLAVMRFFLLQYICRHKAGEKMREELCRYRACGTVFLFLNLALTLIIFFMIHWNRTFVHHEITAIALAAYTFTSFVFAVINMVKYRKLGSPVYSASKAIGLAAACVSMITLESTMLTAFGEQSSDFALRRIMLAISGGAVSAVIITMAVYMIVHANKELKLLNTEKEVG